MITTPDLIEALAANATPVRRLRPPLARATFWLTFATVILVILAIGHGARPDLTQRLHQLTFVVSIGASLLTGILAAIASFLVSLPDRSRRWVLLPLPALVVWVSTIGYSCLTDWIDVSVSGLHMGEAARCFATLVLTSVPLSLLMFVMIRRAAPLSLMPVALTGSLAVAALTASALSFFHEFDATIMILIWNLGSAAFLVGLGAVLGRHFLTWSPPHPAPCAG